MLRRRLGSLLLTALAACGGPVALPGPPPPPAPPPPTASASPTAPTASSLSLPSSTPCTLAGTVVGHDGKPMKAAHVHFGGRSAAVEPSGRFRLDVKGTGPHRVRFTGVDHAELTAALSCDGASTGVDVTLGTYERLAGPHANAYVLVYARTEASGRLVFRGRHAVRKMPGGRFGAEIDLRKGKGEAFFYAFDDVARGHRINGPADAYEYDAEAGYVGRLPARRGVAGVVIDESRLPPPGLPARIRFADPESRAARVGELWLAAAHRAEEEATRGLSDVSFREALARAAAAEQDPEVRAAQRLAYFVPPSRLGERRDEAIAVARALLEEAPAEAAIWSFAPEAALAAVDLAGRTPERDGTLDRLGEGLVDPEVASELALSRLRAASFAGRVDEATRAHAVLRGRFKDSAAARIAAAYDPARKVRPGVAIPDFDLPVLPEPGSPPRASRAGLRGKVVLIDFWGFWCVPCVAEMRTIHEVAARHRDAGFVVVSVAVNSPLPAVRTFRKVQWPMPWAHVVLDAKNQDDVLEAFEVKSYPAPILVDRAGKIVAAGEELRGEGLSRAVAAALRAP